ncbi:hypothetical protein [Williamsia sp. CHRR-6]|uniref:hypothetical protein n=1 Tax=Williamsia sp. CHRR-6 TaxID=2835871 RepID=UPI001BDB2D04|nr:hypothetical protein [Williamsia sp. CHRR-6]MBT0565623.1 hypothetical protein [Williamsia sp. CHRR-6]
MSTNDEHPTDSFETLPPAQARRRGPSAVAVLRTVSGLTVLAVVIAATFYADAGRHRVVSVPAAEQAVAQVSPRIVVPSVPQPGPPLPAAAAPAPAPAAPAVGAPAAAVAISPGSGVTLPGATPITPGAPGTSAPMAPGAAGAGVPGASVAIGTDTGAGAFGSVPVATQPKCPLGWPAPERSGGLGSIVELAPMFGVFSSEVFALAPVMQPLLQLVGPFLAELEPIIHANLPWIRPILDRVQAAGAVVLKAILPFYGPYREQFLKAEGQFAAMLAPVLTRAYQTPAAACLVAWEGQIIAAAKGRPIRTTVLSRPGQTVILRPQS